MITIAICDDEKNVRSYLSALIKEQKTECKITEYASADEYLSKNAEPDLLFLDIALNASASDMSGMELAKEIRNNEFMKQPIIIFVTSLEKYVYDAFDVNAFQYLIKPVNEQKFAEVFNRAAKQILQETEQKKKRLTIRYGGARRSVAFDSIYYIESRNHKVAIHIKNRELEYYAKIGDLEKELQGQFYRIHKSFLINLFHVEEYNRTQVTLTNGEKLPLSKYKYDDFVKAHLRFMQ